MEWIAQLSPMGTVWLWLWEWLQHSPVLLGLLCCLEAEAPSQPVSGHLQIFLRASGLDSGPFLLWVVVGGQNYPCFPLPPTPLVSHLPPTPQQDLSFLFPFPASGELGWEQC